MQHTKNRTRNHALGGRWESGEGGLYVITGGAGLLSGWQNTLRSTARRSKVVVKNRKKVPAGPRHIA